MLFFTSSNKSAVNIVGSFMPHAIALNQVFVKIETSSFWVILQVDTWERVDL